MFNNHTAARPARHRSWIVLGAAPLLLAVTLTGCSSAGGSVEEFCGVVADHKTEYVDAMGAAGTSDLFSGLVGAVSAIGNLKVMWADLADAAPAEIRSEVEAVESAWADMESAAASGDIAGALTGSLLNMKPIESVDAYVVENCGPEYKMF